jgi:hypothetical protein
MTLPDQKTAPSPRQDHEPPAATASRGWRYHHLGIPTDNPRPKEQHLPQYGMHVSGFETSEFGIEWMRFDKDSPLPEIIRTIPHLAFAVDDLEIALSGRELLFAVQSPSEGVRTAMILEEGAPIERMEFQPPPERPR